MLGLSANENSNSGGGRKGTLGQACLRRLGENAAFQSCWCSDLFTYCHIGLQRGKKCKPNVHTVLYKKIQNEPKIPDWNKTSWIMYADFSLWFFCMQTYFALVLLVHLHEVWIYSLLITTKENLTDIKCIPLHMTWLHWKLRIICKYSFLCLVLRIHLKFSKINEDLKGWAATAGRGVQHLSMSRMCKSESVKALFHLYTIDCLLSRDASPEIPTFVYCYRENNA